MPESRAYDTEVLVLGAGLAGSCVALALAESGRSITMLDRGGSAMSGASGNTEAKIHLGYVYALDETLKTQRRMMTGALTFGPLLDRWLGPQRWESMRGPLFSYAVMPDSMLDADELEARYEQIADVFKEVREDAEHVVRGSATYLGRPFDGRVQRKRGGLSGPLVRGQRIDTVFGTEEVSADPDRVSAAVRRALQHPSIDVRTRTEVHEARRHGDGFAVAVTEPDGVTAWWRAPIVVNCLWEDRLRVDASVGLASPAETWTYRVKYLVMVKPRRGVDTPTMTMVQGPYGDIISWDESRVCLSWYPAARTVMETVGRNGVADRPVRAGHAPRSVVDAIIATMTPLFPSLEGAKVTDVRGGVIMAPGATDIDDPSSLLHERANPSVHEHNGWFSVDTGKYTLAPLLAYVASRKVDAALKA